jgi:hypothetical protein
VEVEGGKRWEIKMRFAVLNVFEIIKILWLNVGRGGKWIRESFFKGLSGCWSIEVVILNEIG